MISKLLIIKLGHSAAYSVADHQGLAGTVNPHTSVGQQLLYILCYSTFSMPVIVIILSWLTGWSQSGEGNTGNVCIWKIAELMLA